MTDATTTGPTAWTTGWPTVVRGSRPAGTLTLAELGDPGRFTALVPVVQALTTGRRQAAVTLVHFGLVAVSTALVGPLGRDGLGADVAAEHVGLVVDDALDFDAVWIGRADLEPADGGGHDLAATAREVGRRARALVDPLIAAACAAGPVGARGLELVVLQSLTAACRRTATGAWAPAGADWAADFLEGLGLRSRLPDRTMRLQPDDGPPVDLTVPRVCCVLHVTPSCHACPTCPKMPLQQRRTTALDYLAGMDDEEFAAEVGRARIGPARRA